MPKKMCTAPNQFFIQCREDEEAKLPQKIKHLERMMIYYFYGSTFVGLLKGGSGANQKVTNAFLLNTALLESTDYFLLLNSFP